MSYTIQFAYSGGDYTTCSIRSYTDNTYTSYTILGSIPYSNNGSFTTILDLDAYFIKFVPLDSDGNEGTPSTENSKSKNSVIYNYNYVTSESVYLPEFTYNLYYLVIGGGGSGGAAGGPRPRG